MDGWKGKRKEKCRRRQETNIHKYAIRRCRILVNVIINSHVRFMLTSPHPQSPFMSFRRSALCRPHPIAVVSVKLVLTMPRSELLLMKLWVDRNMYEFIWYPVPHVLCVYWLFHLSLRFTKKLLTHSHLYSFIRILFSVHFSYFVYFMKGRW